MNRTPPPGTLLDLPLIQERYGRAFLASLAIHGLLLAFVLIAPFLMPSISPLHMGTGPGGGSGGEAYAVGVADDLGGGSGLLKPATTPQPPAMPIEKVSKKEEDPSRAVPIPEPTKSKKKPAESPAAKTAKVAATDVIPVEGALGAGGAGGRAGGSGGGAGGGSGVSIGSGSGGLVDSWYARVVEARISQAWVKPIGLQQRIEIVFSFLVADDGRIYDIKKEKSSGNDALDLAAERAIRASTPLLQPPPELRGKPLQFVCQFVYPPF